MKSEGQIRFKENFSSETSYNLTKQIQYSMKENFMENNFYFFLNFSEMPCI